MTGRRRIVTGHDAQGRSIIVSDGPAPAMFDRGHVMAEELWIANQSPPLLDEEHDPAAVEESALNPPPGGAVFRIVTGLPGKGQMHFTETLDFVVVVSGEVYLIMEEGETKLGPGDTVIQRGTNHAWENRGVEPFVMAGILISAIEAE